MARYILSHRRAGKFGEDEHLQSRATLGVALRRMEAEVNVVRDFEPEDPEARRVLILEAEPADIAARMRDLPPDVLLEPEIIHWPLTNIPIDFIGVRAVSATTAPAAAGATRSVTVQVLGAGSPLAHATVLLFLRGPGGAENKLEGFTNASGDVSFSFASFWRPSALVAVPYAGFWTMVVRGIGSSVRVDCPSLPQDGPTGWWHEFVGSAADLQVGAGIRVGVADTGFGPHPGLAHVTDAGAFINGQHQPGGAADADSHGSHVCGIIGARPVGAGEYAGIAPGVDLVCARVFPPGGGANQGDIANAIDELSRNRGVDLINLSLGATSGSQIEQDAIRDALERGTVCVCAAGNEAGPVLFPAAFSETVAVSALGFEGWGPAGSLAASRLPVDRTRFGDNGLYLANFSCFGPEVTVAGPGVGLLSTVPARHGLATPYAVMDGTSMASPAVCAVWSGLLAQDATYTQLPRDKTRAQMALAILRQHVSDIGLDARFQGLGLPGL